MKVETKTKILDSLLMFTTQLVSYTLLVVNYRAVAHANYFWSASTDFAIASFNFFIIKKIAKSDDSLHLWFGYAMGGLVGSIVGIWISLLIHGS
jgi:hypothetical protein